MGGRDAGEGEREGIENWDSSAAMSLVFDITI